MLDYTVSNMDNDELSDTLSTSTSTDEVIINFVYTYILWGSQMQTDNDMVACMYMVGS